MNFKLPSPSFLDRSFVRRIRSGRADTADGATPSPVSSATTAPPAGGRPGIVAVFRPTPEYFFMKAGPACRPTR